MHTFFCESIGEKGTAAMLSRGERDHLFKTLRARPGETVRLIDGRGRCAAGTVTAEREVEIGEVAECALPAVRLHLFLAAPRKQKMDQLLKQAAELGVWSVQVMHCDYSVALPEGSERWSALLLEGCKQSGNPFLPRIEPPVKFARALELIREKGYCGCYGEVEAAVADGKISGADIAWLVGPEGGFSEAELRSMREAGFAGINLGPYILRLETAAICGLAVLRRMVGNG